MKTFSIAMTAAAALASGLLSVAPAAATDGATAIDMCKKLANCSSTVSSKGDVLILVDDHGITCPSLTEQCVVAWNVAAPPGGGTYQPPPSLSGSESSDDEVAATPAPGPGPIL